MTVDKIDYSDKYNLVIVTISGEDFFLSYDFYNELSVVSGDEIDFDIYKDILSEDEVNRAKNYALSKISYSQKSSYEIRKLLKDKDYSLDSIDKTMTFLEDFHLIDDDLYVKSYVSDKSNISKWPKNKIRYSLKAKNLDESIIEKYLSEIDSDFEFENAKNFAEKKARGDFSIKSKQKVYRNLASKGFDFDIINRVMEDLF